MLEETSWGKKVTNKHPFDFSHASALMTIAWYALGVQKSIGLSQNKKIKLFGIWCEKELLCVWENIRL